jgi:hypothetical protein
MISLVVVGTSLSAVMCAMGFFTRLMAEFIEFMKKLTPPEGTEVPPVLDGAELGGGEGADGS